MKKIILPIALSIMLASTTSEAYEKKTSRVPQEISSPTEQYTVLKKLGEGFFGKIFAVASSQGGLFALKSYKVADQDIFSDTAREFLNGQILHHPHIIKSHELFTSATAPSKKYLVLDLVEGETLLKTPKGALSYEESLKAAVDLCEALKHAFLLGFVHVDLNPTNVMLTANKEIMIIDLASFLNLDEMEHSLIHKEREQVSKKALFESIQKCKQRCLGKKKSKATCQRAKSDFPKKPPPKRLQAKEHKQQVSKKIQKFSRQATYIPNQEQLKKDFSLGYLNAITEMCSAIISKSNLPRPDKYSLKAEIKKISWGFEEDSEDHCEESLEVYFDQLVNALQNPKFSE